jgi:homogentisate phytyltransferase / homogentisate geranylgeranyltransferase
MQFLTTLWQFGRPHTIIGSTLSIIALYLIAASDSDIATNIVPILLPSLGSALACNVYITGLNQWADVEVDRINKPWLPIPAGRLDRAGAMRIVSVAGVLALGLSAVLSGWFFALLLLIMAIGTAYSLPPLSLKRHHLLAASAILLVRGLLVNLGFYLHFRHELTGHAALDPVIWPLTAFVIAFSLGIAWFKDIPDTQGDAVHRFGTLAVREGRRRAFSAGVIVVSVAYAIVLLGAALGWLPAAAFYIGTHLSAWGLFLWRARTLDVEDNVQVKRFYLFFWGLFFFEYVAYPLGLYL